jgi:hypothetical protein
MPYLKPSVAFLAERFGPLVAGVLAGLAILRFPALWLLRASWREFLLDKMLDIEIGVLAGLLAIVAFLPAIEEKTVIRKFKQWGYYRFLVGYLKEAVFIAACATVCSIALIVLPDSWKTNTHIDRAISALWWGLVIYSGATCFRIVKLSLKSLLAK